MSLLNSNTPDDVNKEFDDIDRFMEDQEIESNKKKRQASAWVVSIVMHCAVLLLLGAIVLNMSVEKDEPTVQMTYIIPQPPPVTERKTERVPVENVIVVTEEDEKEKFETLVEIEDIVISNDNNETEVSVKGREDATSVSETGGNQAFMITGAGGGAAGAFGRKVGGDKIAGIRGYGKNAREATSTLDAALRWLVRHQSPNGMWDSDNYFINCQEGNKMEPGKDVGGADEALTGYAVLCFLGAGYDHRMPSRYRNVVKNGIDWLVSIQKPSGLIGNRNYEHAVCAMALAEAYAMSKDPALKMPTQKAIDILLERQTKNNEYGLGWDYVNGNPSRQDNSVSGWAVMALKAATSAGINVGNGLHGSKSWLEGSWKAANPGWEKLDPYGKSIFPYTWNTISGRTQKDHLSFIGAMCSVFIDHNDKLMLNTLLNDMTTRWFDTGRYKLNSYCLYYASLASFQGQNGHWKEKWGNEENGYVPWLIQTQHKTGDCRDGTWPLVNESWHGHDTSPVLIHVYKVLAIETAWRYELVK